VFYGYVFMLASRCRHAYGASRVSAGLFSVQLKVHKKYTKVQF